MIVKNTRNNQVELAFGKGDICIAGGYIRDEMLNKMGLVSFINQDARDIGIEGIIKGGTPYLVGEFPVIMTFTKTESIDALISQLLQAKEEMKVEVNFETLEHDGVCDSSHLNNCLMSMNDNFGN